MNMQPTRYSQRSLAEKLGLKPGMRVCILNAPDGYLQALGAIVAQVELTENLTPAHHCDLIHLFLREDSTALERVSHVKPALKTSGALWISWPKKSANVVTDISESAVREIGLAVGLVDVKVAAIDSIWSGLKFVYRQTDR